MLTLPVKGGQAKDIRRHSAIQFFVISTLLTYTNAHVVRCRRTPRDDSRFWDGFCKSEGKLNTDTYTNLGMLGLRVQNIEAVDHANFRDLCHLRGYFPKDFTDAAPFNQESLKRKLCYVLNRS